VLDRDVDEGDEAGEEVVEEVVDRIARRDADVGAQDLAALSALPGEYREPDGSAAGERRKQCRAAATPVNGEGQDGCRALQIRVVSV
jgi:hypothetical protein